MKALLRSRLPGLVRSSALALLVPLVASASASALGTPLSIGTVALGPGTTVSQVAPSVAVDAAGRAYIAWNAYEAGSPVVEYCVLPDGATACSPSGTLTPAPGADDYLAPQVLINDGIVSIIADVGTPGGQFTSSSPDEPLQEWQAPDGSATFTAVNGGQSPAVSDVNDTSGIPQAAVDVPGTNELGVLWIGANAPSFTAFPLINPPQCSVETSPPCAAAALEPSSNPDQIGPFSGEAIAAGAGPAPGILAIFPTDAATGPLGCPTDLQGDHVGTAFAYGSGLQSATNSYNISPGSPDSAWQVPVTQLDCQHFVGAATGGPGGFGVLRSPVSLPLTPHSTISVTYLPFDQTTLSFDKPPVTVVPAPAYAEEASVTQDSSGGMYAVYGLESIGGKYGGNGPLVLSYSADGGATWQGPAPLIPTLPNYLEDATSSVGANGDGWVTFVVGSTIEAVSFDTADAATPLSAAIATPSVSSASVTLPVRCTVVPCTVSTALTSAVPAPAARHGAKVVKPVRLGSGDLTITKPGEKKLVVHLPAAGQRLLTATRRHLKVTLSEGTRLGSYVAKRTASLTLALPTKRR